MKIASRLLTVLLVAALSGCALADFKPYVGAQQNWPTAPGTFMVTKYAVPVYYGPPPRPYSVLGYLDATTAPIRRRGVVAFAARRAKEIGGDAIIVMEEGSEYSGTYSSGSYRTRGNIYGSGYASTTTGSTMSVPMFLGRASALIIKFR